MFVICINNASHCLSWKEGWQTIQNELLSKSYLNSCGILCLNAWPSVLPLSLNLTMGSKLYEIMPHSSWKTNSCCATSARNGQYVDLVPPLHHCCLFLQTTHSCHPHLYTGKAAKCVVWNYGDQRKKHGTFISEHAWNRLYKNITLHRHSEYWWKTTLYCYNIKTINIMHRKFT